MQDENGWGTQKVKGMTKTWCNNVVIEKCSVKIRDPCQIQKQVHHSSPPLPDPKHLLSDLPGLHSLISRLSSLPRLSYFKIADFKLEITFLFLEFRNIRISIILAFNFYVQERKKCRKVEIILRFKKEKNYDQDRNSEIRCITKIQKEIPNLLCSLFIVACVEVYTFSLTFPMSELFSEGYRQKS